LSVNLTLFSTCHQFTGLTEILSIVVLIYQLTISLRNFIKCNLFVYQTELTYLKTPICAISFKHAKIFRAAKAAEFKWIVLGWGGCDLSMKCLYYFNGNRESERKFIHSFRFYNSTFDEAIWSLTVRQKKFPLAKICVCLDHLQRFTEGLDLNKRGYCWRLQNKILL